jgi:hypothetical protein
MIYQAGKAINIEYSANQPDHVQLPSWSNNTYGAISIGFGSLIVFLAYINLWLLRRFPGYAKIAGGIEAAGDVTRVVRAIV